jgi:hypothetical protein
MLKSHHCTLFVNIPARLHPLFAHLNALGGDDSIERGAQAEAIVAEEAVDTVHKPGHTKHGAGRYVNSAGIVEQTHVV